MGRIRSAIVDTPFSNGPVPFKKLRKLFRRPHQEQITKLRTFLFCRSFNLCVYKILKVFPLTENIYFVVLLQNYETTNFFISTLRRRRKLRNYELSLFLAFASCSLAKFEEVGGGEFRNVCLWEVRPITESAQIIFD